MGPQPPEQPIAAPVSLDQPTKPTALPVEPAPPPANLNAVGEVNFMKAMEGMNKATETVAPSQPDLTHSNGPTPEEEAARQKFLNAIAEAEAAQSKNKGEAPPPQIPPIQVKENKSFIAALYYQIKNIVTAPARALAWVRGKVNALRESFNTLFRPPQSPKQTA